MKRLIAGLVVLVLGWTALPAAADGTRIIWDKPKLRVKEIVYDNNVELDLLMKNRTPHLLRFRCVFTVTVVPETGDPQVYADQTYRSTLEPTAKIRNNFFDLSNQAGGADPVITSIAVTHIRCRARIQR